MIGEGGHALLWMVQSSTSSHGMLMLALSSTVLCNVIKRRLEISFSCSMLENVFDSFAEPVVGTISKFFSVICFLILILANVYILLLLWLRSFQTSGACWSPSRWTLFGTGDPCAVLGVLSVNSFPKGWLFYSKTISDMNSPCLWNIEQNFYKAQTAGGVWFVQNSCINGAF